MVNSFEGREAAEIAAHWLKQSAATVSVLRGTGETVAGVLIKVAVEKSTAVAKAWAFLQRQAALRPVETATLFRFWMAHDTYQDVSPTQTRIFLNIVQHYLTTPGLAYAMLPCGQSESIHG